MSKFQAPTRAAAFELAHATLDECARREARLQQ
jgi:hypothetical protein